MASRQRARGPLFPRPEPVPVRTLRCVGTCGELVDVVEIPPGWINPAEYECGDCLRARGYKGPDKQPPLRAV